MFPCHECAKAIIQSGIKEVIYLSDKYNGTPSNLASKKMLEMSKIKTRKIDINIKTIEINLEESKFNFYIFQ